jgi:hypothetical protein
MTLDGAEKYLYDGIKPAVQSQVTMEIDRLFDLYGPLKPMMWISSHRTAWQGVDEDTSLRITFDSNILWREENLNLSDGVWGKPILLDGQHIMEIKCTEALPFWLARLLSHLEIYPTSFSKYGTAYKKSFQNKGTDNKGDIRC